MLVWKNSSEGEKRILAKCEAIVFISEVGFERCLFAQPSLEVQAAFRKLIGEAIQASLRSGGRCVRVLLEEVLNDSRQFSGAIVPPLRDEIHMAAVWEIRREE